MDLRMEGTSARDVALERLSLPVAIKGFVMGDERGSGSGRREGKVSSEVDPSEVGDKKISVEHNFIW